MHLQNLGNTEALATGGLAEWAGHCHSVGVALPKSTTQVYVGPQPSQSQLPRMAAPSPRLGTPGTLQPSHTSERPRHSGAILLEAE